MRFFNYGGGVLDWVDHGSKKNRKKETRTRERKERKAEAYNMCSSDTILDKS